MGYPVTSETTKFSDFMVPKRALGVEGESETIRGRGLPHSLEIYHIYLGKLNHDLTVLPNTGNHGK